MANTYKSITTKAAKPSLTHIDVDDLHFDSPTDLEFTVLIDDVSYWGELDFHAGSGPKDAYFDILRLEVLDTSLKAPDEAVNALHDYIDEYPDPDRLSFHYQEQAAAEGDRLYDQMKDDQATGGRNE